MARPPKNGYTVNSDNELSALDTSILPANTPMLNFERKCWEVYMPEVRGVVTSILPYTPTTPIAYSYQFGALANINDNTSVAVTVNTSTTFEVITTFSTPTKLISFFLTNGQFNGDFNAPTRVDVYVGTTKNPSNLLGVFNISQYSRTQYTLTNAFPYPVSFDSSVSYLFVFYSTGSCSIRELELFGEGEVVLSQQFWDIIPQNQINAYTLTPITISTATYELDLSTVSQYLSITLTRNTDLSVINSSKYTKYYIELIPNGHIIKNFTDLFKLAGQYSIQRLLSSYFGKQVLELQYINQLYANINYSDNISPSGSIGGVEKINWEAPASEVLYLAWASSVTTYTGSGISSVSTTVGTPSISKSRLLLGSTGRLEATKTSALDFDETDFTISFFSAKTSVGEYGCILGSHKASSIGFYVGVAADSTLFAVFGSNTLFCTLPDDIAEHSVVINRIGRVYKIFIDGVLSAHLKAANNFNNNSTEPLCIGSLKNATGTPSWTSQSWQGYLRQLTVNTAASIPFSANDVPPKDTATANTVLLLKYNVSDLDFAQYSLARSFTSNVTVQPLIASGRLNKYSHIGYIDSNLEITGDATLEAKIFNPSSNTRGAIIDVEGGFTWGIYDLKLRIIFGSFTLDGVTDIPDSTVVDVSFVKSGTTCSLFLNGELEATATTSEVMNTSSSASEFSIKRTYTQDNSVASPNTSLFRSRSWIEIAQLRVTKSARYTNNYIPDVFYGS
ncbi:MAG: hypothetical protein IM526_02560 [Microcystis sp. M38BS1]|uniref:LamG-like jellyroll fold domain-containing protein n=1 Tax=Microcystis sp. M38BS1 TaxID=2771188 RepID=UPI0031FC9939|nr:hypothetical protein [Microcystis sp. M38BS1]MCA6582541.1 hypothetical protein [Pseudanabaena sp. M34BS1SP1A06MG]